MKRKTLSIAVVTTCAVLLSLSCHVHAFSSNVIGSHVNEPDNSGILFRANAMIGNENYIGALDQLALLDIQVLSDSEKMQADWLKCHATSHIDKTHAAKLLKEFLNDYKSSELRYKALLLLGDCLLEKSPEDALRVYDEVNSGALPEDAISALDYHKAYALLQTGDIDAAELFFNRARQYKEWSANADFYLGYIAYTRRDYATAMRFFENADRRSRPGNMADYYLAQIYYAEGNYGKALSNAQNVIAQNDIDVAFKNESMRIYGESLFQLGNTDEAIAILQQYIGSTDQPARSTLYILGTNEFKSGKPANALNTLRKVVETDEHDVMSQSAYLFIGQSLMATGDINAAILAFDNALKMDFDSDVRETAFYNYAVSKFSGARMPFGSSAATFEEFLRIYPDSKYAPQVQEYLIDGYLTDGDYETALASIRRMSHLAPKVLDAKQRVLYVLGTRSLSKNDTDGAIAYLQEAYSMKGRDKATAARIALSLGEAYARKGDHRKAIGMFDNYLKESPANDINRRLAYYDLGYSYFALKDYKKSSQYFSKTSSVRNNEAQPWQDVRVQIDVQNRLGDCYLYLGELSNASKHYRQAYDLQPNSGDYPLFQSAVIQGYERNYKNKIASLETLLDEFPTSSLIPDALLEMTESYIQLGDNTSAVNVYRRLVSEYASTEQGRKGYLQMALTLYNSGRKKEAVEAYRDVVKLYPTSEEARMAVDELKRISADDGSLPEFAQWLQSVDNAPKLDIAETERLIFEAAEKTWLTEKNTARLEKYLADYPDGNFNVMALGYLTDNAVAKKNHREVIRLSSQIIERYPDSSQSENALMAKAKAEESLGLSDDALGTWMALETRASSPHSLNTARTGIMRTARDTGDDNRVIAAADALLASSTLGSEVRNEAVFSRAFALARSGRTNDAITEWKTLSSDKEDLYGVKSSYYIAEYEFNAGNTDSARREVESIIDSATPHSYWLARGFILLSDIYAREGKKFEAREYLKSLRENYPGNETDIFDMIDQRLKKL